MPEGRGTPSPPMCLAIPGKIVKIENNVALVDYGSERREGRIVVGEYDVGDYVIIQGGLVIERVPEKQAKNWLNAFITAHRK